MALPTYPAQVETRHARGFVVSDLGPLSYDPVTLTGAKIQPGTVLGSKTVGASATSAVLGTNVGDGTMGAVTLVTKAAQVGVYSLLYTAPTAFTVTAPDGSQATGTNGNAFSDLGIGFTMTTGGTPMVAGDGFTITVVDAVGKPTATSAANAGNTGNSTSSAVTTTGYPPMPGVYKVSFLRNATNLGTFAVEDPLGRQIGHGVVGTAFTGGGITFTIADGATDFQPGDQFAITVVAGSAKYAPLSLSDVTGLAVASAIAYDYTDASGSDQAGTALARLAQVNASELVWPAGMSAAAKATALTQLARQHIIAR